MLLYHWRADRHSSLWLIVDCFDVRFGFHDGIFCALTSLHALSTPRTDTMPASTKRKRMGLPLMTASGKAPGRAPSYWQDPLPMPFEVDTVTVPALSEPHVQPNQKATVAELEGQGRRITKQDLSPDSPTLAPRIVLHARSWMPELSVLSAPNSGILAVAAPPVQAPENGSLGDEIDSKDGTDSDAGGGKPAARSFFDDNATDDDEYVSGNRWLMVDG